MPVTYTQAQWEKDSENWTQYFLNKPVQLQDLYSRWDACFAYTEKLAKEGNPKAIKFKNFIKTHHFLKPADQTPNLHGYYKKFRFDAADIKNFKSKETKRNKHSEEKTPFEDVTNVEYVNFVRENLFAPKVTLPRKWSLDHINNATAKTVANAAIKFLTKTPSYIIANSVFALANKLLKLEIKEYSTIEILPSEKQNTTNVVAPISAEEMQKLLRAR